MSLRNQPLLGDLLLALRAVVGGRLELLKDHFEAQVSGTPAEWHLDLRPMHADVSRYIEWIHVSGHGPEPLRFEIIERSGDRTVTEIEPR